MRLYNLIFLSLFLVANPSYSNENIQFTVEFSGGCKMIFFSSKNRIDFLKSLKGDWTGACNKNKFLNGYGTASLYSSTENWSSVIKANFVDGVEQGAGSFSTSKDDVEIDFSGFFEDGKIKYGQWKRKSKKSILDYKGNFKNGKFNGTGSLFVTVFPPEGGVVNYTVEGNFLEGLVNGPGKFIWADETAWIGNFSAGKLNGVGQRIKPNGEKEVIEYVDDKLGSAHPGDGTEAHYWCAQHGYVYQTIDYARCRTIFSSNQRLEKLERESLERESQILSNIQNNYNKTNPTEHQLEEISRQQKLLIQQQKELLRNQADTKPEIEYKPIKVESTPLKPQLYDIKTGKPIKN